MNITVDLADLKPGDVVIRVEPYEDGDYPGEISVTVDRKVAIPPHRYHNLDGPAECDRCQMLRDNRDWLDAPKAPSPVNIWEA